MTLIAGNRSPTGLSSARMAYATNAVGVHLLAVSEHARWIAEYVNGNTDSAFGNLSQTAPPTPALGEQSPGHDHTGGLMGHPQKHTIWQHAWGYEDGTNIENNEAPLASSAVFSNVSRLIDAPIGAVWCPPGYVYAVGCEVQLIVRVVTDTCTINARCEVNGVGTEQTAFGATVSNNTITLDKLVPMRPGWNNVHLKVEVTAWITAADQLEQVELAYSSRS
jgi:hypothetical protein